MKKYRIRRHIYHEIDRDGTEWSTVILFEIQRRVWLFFWTHMFWEESLEMARYRINVATRKKIDETKIVE